MKLSTDHQRRLVQALELLIEETEHELKGICTELNQTMEQEELVSTLLTNRRSNGYASLQTKQKKTEKELVLLHELKDMMNHIDHAVVVLPEVLTKTLSSRL